MTAKERYLRPVNLLFVLLLVIVAVPGRNTDEYALWLVGTAVVIEAVTLAASALFKKKQSLQLFTDIVGFLYVFLSLWTLATVKTGLLKRTLFPPFGTIIHQFYEDRAKIIVNIGASLSIIAQGFFLALIVAIPLGLVIASNARAGNAASYITKFFSSIPPIVYIPYGIALLPTLHSCSVMVVFLASFWPVFAATMSGVMGVDKKILDSAKVLSLSRLSMLFEIYLPAALPQIFLGVNQGLSVSFILLTSAEMIGAQDGMGYYVKNYSDFGDYTRTIVGLLVIGFVVIAVTFAVGKVQKALLKWK